MANPTGPTPPETDAKSQAELYELLVKSTAQEERMLEILKEKSKHTSQYLDVLKAENELSKSRLLNLGQNLEIWEKIGGQTDELLKKQKEIEEKLKKQNSSMVSNKGLLQQKEEIIKKINKAKEDELKKIKEILKDDDIMIKQGDKRLKLSEALANVTGTEAEKMQQRKDLLEQGRAELKNYSDVQNKVDKVSGKIAKSMGLQAQFSETSLGKMTGFVEQAKMAAGAMGKKALVGSLMAAGKQAFGLKNIFASVLETTAKLALEINNTSKALGAATGFGDQFNNEIRRMGQQGIMAGIGYKEAGQAIQALADGVSSFNPAAERTNEYMGMTIARLSKLGVNSGSAAKSMDFLQRTMKMSGKAAADMTAQIVRFGKQIGVTGTKMLEQFNSAAGRLAIYGKNNIKVFKELAAQAKATGLEIGSLLSMTQKFDTFDSAADSAAKLNAVLGTQLSTIEMMNASDSERVMMIKQQVQASVGNFDSLDKYTKMYVAQAMGVGSVDEAQRLLNMSTAEYQQHMAKQQASADVQKEISDATEELVPMMEQLKLAGVKVFMAFGPLIRVFTNVVNLISWIVTAFGKVVGAFDEGGEAVGGFGEVVVAAMAAAAAAMLAFGTATAVATGGISLLVGGLGALWAAHHKKGSPELWDLPNHSGEAYENMAKSMTVANEAALANSEAMDQVHKSMHKAGGKSFSIEAMAKLDTNKLANGIQKVKSALMELSTLKIDGFLAMTTDGSSSSMIMGSEGLIKQISDGRLTVDVKMPDMKMPDINVKVYIGDRELRDIVRTEVGTMVGAAG